MAETRKVWAQYWDDKWSKHIPVLGIFHQWAANYDEYESGPGNYTVALVEDETGQIRECLPSTVKFLP